MATTVLKLPDELLLNIALQPGFPEGAIVPSLRALSLTCRHLRPIAQEALIRTATVSIEHIWRLSELLGTQPSLASDRCDAMMIAYSRGPALAEQCYQTFCSITKDVRSLFNFEKRMKNSSLREEDFYSIGLLAVIAQSPGIRKLSLGSNFLDLLPMVTGVLDHERFLSEILISESYQQAQASLEARLEDLEVIYEQPIYNLSGTRLLSINDVSCLEQLNLRRFKHLKHVVIPFAYLADEGMRQASLDYYFFPSIHGTDFSTILPPSLESVMFSFDDTHKMMDTLWFDNLILSTTVFPCLERVGFQFELNVLSTAWLLCSRNSRFGQQQLDGFRKWSASKVAVRTTFGAAKFADSFRGKARVKSDVYVEGDIIEAIERSLATTHLQLEQDPELMEELGYKILT
ncbi:hypothetical protein P153DRAFT_362076 [Dothidotthia symphoricarpi CBS 119687]|uniref:F-box domain-containing protein n=1 Tax=Dothidotthia symphoricarpi CBS 119687 TaxID=1392245 RepID=A0A6A5ZVR2_9PLEO|nr:uncharacterized protein P153DRAFT_362076 [Dothidotthia symphoricarpi CBS 119687]KAF2123376.1 hypothetical protein P153DRAFT_362076 [Dothidotthia symphoricarpi CBS 119687]